MSNKLSRFLLFFLIFLIALQLFGPKPEEKTGRRDDIAIDSKDKFVTGQEFLFSVRNHTQTPLEIKSACPEPPLKVERYQNGTWSAVQVAEGEQVTCDAKNINVAADESQTISLTPWSLAFFQEQGRYRVTLHTEDGRAFSREFQVKAAGFFRAAWNTAFFRPIFNTLIFFLDKLPGHSLGWAIILLTVFIKLILLGPNQKALRSQKKMQEVQPQLEALKLKYKNEPQRLAQETMAIWKKHKVSPMGSCLPLLIQFPVLIALFYVVQSDLGSVKNLVLLYEPLKGVDMGTIQTNFLGIIELTKKNVVVLPVIVGLLQFAQMKLSLGRQKLPENKDGKPNPAVMMNRMMIYMMPVMIAFFTASLPAAVGFYWGASTLFGIGQQVAVNRSKN